MERRNFLRTVMSGLGLIGISSLFGKDDKKVEYGIGTSLIKKYKTTKWVMDTNLYELSKLRKYFKDRAKTALMFDDLQEYTFNNIIQYDIKTYINNSASGNKKFIYDTPFNHNMVKLNRSFLMSMFKPEIKSRMTDDYITKIELRYAEILLKNNNSYSNFAKSSLFSSITNS